MRSFGIVMTCIAAAVIYGILHDEITARICVEYFTVGHPDLFGTEDPTLLGLGWGIVATWWMGLLLGVPLAWCARFGARSKRSPRSLIRPILCLLAVMAASSAIAGVIGWQLADHGILALVGPIASEIAEGKRTAFIADLWAHSASYLVGLLGGIALMISVWRSRGQPHRAEPVPTRSRS